MTPAATLLWLLNMTFDAFGQLAFKAAAITEDSGNDEQFLSWSSMASNRWIWIGIGCYVAVFFLWLAFLSFVPLSEGILLGSINILAVMVGGRVFFGEEITKRRLTAIALIAIGVALVGWGS